MSSLAILIRTAPYGLLEAAEGVRHLAGREALGFDQTVGLFCDEGVRTLVAEQQPLGDRPVLEQELRSLTARGAQIIVERASLEERGLGLDELIPGVELAESLERPITEADAVLVF